jgi:hypothetical protein
VARVVPAVDRVRAALRVVVRDLEDVLVDMVAVRVVEVAIVQEVDVLAVTHRGMAAVVAVLVCVTRVGGVIVMAHGLDGRRDPPHRPQIGDESRSRFDAVRRTGAAAAEGFPRR